MPLPHYLTKKFTIPNSANGFAEPPAVLGSGNPVGERSLETDENEDDYLQFNIATEVKLFEGLSYQLQFGSNVENTYNFYHLPEYSFGPQATVEDPFISESRARVNSWTLNNILNYQNTFGEHSVGLMGGISREKK